MKAVNQIATVARTNFQGTLDEATFLEKLLQWHGKLRDNEVARRTGLSKTVPIFNFFCSPLRKTIKIQLKRMFGLSSELKVN